MTIPRYALQAAVQSISSAIGEDAAVVRRRFRHWAGLGMIPARATGAGVGTRRTYSQAGVLLGAVLVLLSRHGVGGEGLGRLSLGLGQAISSRGFENLRRYGGLLFVDLDTATYVPARIAMAGAPALPAPAVARLTVNVGALAERIVRSSTEITRTRRTASILAGGQAKEPGQG
jgi:hypothetical protein